MKRTVLFIATLAMMLSAGVAARAEMAFWGIQVEQLEYRAADNDVAAWDLDAFYGTDELKLVLRSEAEYETGEKAFEALENQLRLQTPISDFFDAVVGVRASTPKGPDRYAGVVGLHGLAPQWFEVDLDLFLSDNPSLRFEAEYEGLITNRIIAVPSIKIDLPFTDDTAVGVGSFAPKLEIGLRVSYDLIDRAFSPYIGVHYEKLFGESADLARAEGEDTGTVYFVLGARIMY